MKKSLYSLIVLLNVLVVSSCSSDDNKGKTDTGCVTCSVSFEGGSNTKEICNVDGIAYDNDYNTGIPYEDYVNAQESLGYSCTGH